MVTDNPYQYVKVIERLAGASTCQIRWPFPSSKEKLLIHLKVGFFSTKTDAFIFYLTECRFHFRTKFLYGESA